ncbi:phage integrase [Fructobacillus fructosus]|nr:phage integrase [Fructobacillus fructosus]
MCMHTKVRWYRAQAPLGDVVKAAFLRGAFLVTGLKFDGGDAEASISRYGKSDFSKA